MKQEEKLDNSTIVTLVDGVLRTICLHTGEIVSANNLNLVTQNKVHVYSLDVARLICDYVRTGVPFTEIEKLPHMPPYNTVAAWRKAHPDFAEAIKLAKRDRAEIYHDRVLKEADDIETEEEARIAKVKMDAYKWAAEKNSPEEYGKAPPKENNSGITFVINTGVPNQAATIIEVKDGFSEIQTDREADACEADEREIQNLARERPVHAEVSGDNGDELHRVHEDGGEHTSEG